MSIFNKKIIRNIFLSIIILFSITFSLAYAQENVLKAKKDTNETYNLLQPIGKLKFFSTAQTDENGKEILDSNGNPIPKNCALTEYVNIIFDLLIGICAVLAFIMLVVGGIQYMGSELVSSKEAAKSQATNAILGLLVAFSAWLILNTINPKLLDFCLDKNLQPATIKPTPETIEETLGSAFADGQQKTISLNGQTLTACNKEEIVKINLMGKEIEVNKAVAPELTAINNEWLYTVDPSIKNYKIDTIYGYVCKHVKDQPNKISAHSFGIALDINPSTNPFTKGACQTNMPPAFVKLFTSHGWGWGGNWQSVKDPMHFSKLSSETGGNHPCP